VVRSPIRSFGPLTLRRHRGRRARRAVAVAILAMLSVPAHALELTRSRDIPAPPAAVWALVGEFCAIGRWHPRVERCILSSDEDDDTVRVQIRGLVVKGGLGTVVEVETARDEAAMSYSYSFVQGPLPVGAYNASLAVRPNGAGSTVVWSGSFDAAGVSDAEALADMEGVYEQGLDGIVREAAR
jgi:carbon monoxide dehydrogenase subunit G